MSDTINSQSSFHFCNHLVFMCSHLLTSTFSITNWRYSICQHFSFSSSKHSYLQILILPISRVEGPLKKWLIKLDLEQWSQTTPISECWNVKMHPYLIGKWSVLKNRKEFTIILHPLQKELKACVLMVVGQL